MPVLNRRFTGDGTIVPGAHPEFQDDFSKHTGISTGKVVGAIKRKAGQAARKLFTGLLGPSESETDASAKYQGEMNYYNAKIERSKPKRKP